MKYNYPTHLSTKTKYDSIINNYIFHVCKHSKRRHVASFLKVETDSSENYR